MLNKINWKSLFAHIALFVLIEVTFVLIVFRELPVVSLYTTIWIAHIVYWIVVLACSVWREKSKRLIIRFMALWTPMIIHLLIHIYIWFETIEEHGHWHEHHDWEAGWLVVWTLVAWVLLYYWEKLLHTHQHCTTHHTHAHKACIESEHREWEWK